MKNRTSILVAAGVTLASIATYFIMKAMNKKEVAQPQKKSHHLTNAFAKAKEHALNN